PDLVNMLLSPTKTSPDHVQSGLGWPTYLSLVQSLVSFLAPMMAKGSFDITLDPSQLPHPGTGVSSRI
ncbi:hypothetical protein KIPB_017173, partial [Kipferlia bialata]